MTRTEFSDSFSGGYQKESFVSCFIEAPKKEAIDIFADRFWHHPEGWTCGCCGEDYWVHEVTEAQVRHSLSQATEGEIAVITSDDIALHKAIKRAQERDSHLTPAEQEAWMNALAWVYWRSGPGLVIS